MTRVFVSHPGFLIGGSYQMVCFYEGFINSLLDNGNDVMHYVANDFVSKAWNGSNKLLPGFDRKYIEDKIRKFDPELVIAFNNTTYDNIHKIVDCPIALWDADSLYFYNDKDVIKDNLERYHFLNFSQDGVETAREFGAAHNKIFVVMGATAVKSEDKAQDNNISFIGSYFNVSQQLKNYIEHFPDDRHKLLKVYHEAKKDFYKDISTFVERQNFSDKFGKLTHEEFADAASANVRVKTLSGLAELGLTIYGSKAWSKLTDFNIELALSYQPGNFYTLQHNQDIYNSSKICVNISHAQARKGFPWRIFDILASNGCLVSNYSQGLVQYTKDFFDVPNYTSPAQAKELCQKLLKDDKQRQSIVSAAHNLIEKNGRWHHRFAEMGQIFDLNMVNKERKGSYEKIDPHECLGTLHKSYYQLQSKAVEMIPSSMYPFLYKVATTLRIPIPNKIVQKAQSKM